MATRRPLVMIAPTPTAFPAGDTIPTDMVPANIVLPGNAAVTVPAGTTAQRPANGVAQVRFNADLGHFEGYTANGWVQMDERLVASYRGTVGQLSGTTRMTYGNTAPLITDGTQVWSQSVTPKYVGSIITIEFAPIVDCSNNNQSITLALFKGSTLIGWTMCATAGRPNSMTLICNDTTASLTPVTYSCRIGSAAGTWYLGQGASGTMGGNNQGWKIDEVLP